MSEVSAPVAMIGAGSWGTALAVLLGREGIPVRLWARRPEMAQALRLRRENQQYLPGVAVPESVEPHADLGAALADAVTVVLAVPSAGMRETVRALRPHLAPHQYLISAAKGLEHDTGMRMTQVIAEELPEPWNTRSACLSGPNLAAEVAAGIATTTVIACADVELARQAQELFMQPSFRVYTNPDVVGVELGGALKNIVAIGAGINDGLSFGDNTKAALVTRGLAEITRIGVALGAAAQTFIGLSGIGDLVTTCASRRSRNHYVGYHLALGRTLDDILAGMDMIAEGVPTTRAAVRLADRAGVEMPITRAVHGVLFEGMKPLDAVRALMLRNARDEREELQ
ncbi:MAG: NAD(P)-dependent glycerol-3-phosphate dehydrogenase [Armatimonadota bacterium]|nr:MAG: NAD(P)-dependent glycerol-3-phosphate dehydrogenase [Armatimonadota bacterium]